MSRGYRELKVWQRSMDLALAAYDHTDSFPVAERFGLTSQIRRAAVSVAANIAEGQGRAHRDEFLNHISIARGSLQELETLLLIGERRRYLSKKELDDLTRDHGPRESDAHRLAPIPWAMSVGRSVPTPKRRTPNAERRTPNAERSTLNAQRPTPNAQRPTLNAQRPTPNAQRHCILPCLTHSA